MRLHATLATLWASVAICAAKATPICDPADGTEFKLIATNESSSTHLEHFLKTGHGVSIGTYQGEYYLDLSTSPTVWTLQGGVLEGSDSGTALKSLILDVGFAIELAPDVMQGSDFGWTDNLLTGDIDRGGQPGYFTICKPPVHRPFVYWRKTGKYCPPAWKVTFLQAVTVDST